MRRSVPGWLLPILAAVLVPSVAGCTVDQFRWVGLVDKCGRPIEEQAFWGPVVPVKDGWWAAGGRAP